MGKSYQKMVTSQIGFEQPRRSFVTYATRTRLYWESSRAYSVPNDVLLSLVEAFSKPTEFWVFLRLVSFRPLVVSSL